MSFFANREINWLNLHLALLRFSYDLVFAVFGPIFLYQQGVAIWAIALVFATFHVARLAWRVLLFFPLVNWLGLRNVAFLGTLIISATIAPLAFSQGLDAWFWAFILLNPLGGAIFWTSFHTLYSMHGDNQERGQQFAIVQVAILLLLAVGAAGGAWLISTAGYGWYFAFASLGAIVAGLVLLQVKALPPQQYNLKDLPSAWPQVKRSVCLATAQSSGYQLHMFVWTLVLFATLGQITHVGLVLAVGLLVQVVLLLLLGQQIDKGALKTANTVGCTLMAATVLGRWALAVTLPIILLFEALFALAKLVQDSAFIVAYYNEAKNSKKAIWFQFIGEAGWDFGITGAMLLVAATHYFTGDVRMVMLLAIPALMLVWYLVNRTPPPRV